MLILARQTGGESPWWSPCGSFDELLEIRRISPRKFHRLTSLVLVITTLVLTVPTAEAQALSPRRANLFGVEGLGRGGYGSLIYERYLTSRIGLGVGIGTWEIEEGTANQWSIPLYISWNPIGDTHSLYVGAGASVYTSESSTPDGTVTVGYENRGNDRVAFRLTVSLFVGGDGHLVWPGLLWGRRF